jgi:hypothetical protein
MAYFIRKDQCGVSNVDISPGRKKYGIDECNRIVKKEVKQAAGH